MTTVTDINEKEFTVEFERLLEELSARMASKGKEYSSGSLSGYRYHSFNSIASRRGRDVGEIILSLRDKHSVSVEDIVSGVSRGTSYSQNYIEEKCLDEISYTLLLCIYLLNASQRGAGVSHEHWEDQ